VSRSSLGRERGSASVELAVAAPAFLALTALIVFAGRLEIASRVVENSAAAGARAASLQRSPPAARRAADEVVRRSFVDQQVQCAELAVVVDTGGFQIPLGQPAVVRVRVSCQLRVTDLPLPGAPERLVSSIAVSPLDPYRGRTA
jgi:Flp pilus assembly protein TadG